MDPFYVIGSKFSVEGRNSLDFFCIFEPDTKILRKNPRKGVSPRDEFIGFILSFFSRSRIKCFIMILLSDLFVFPVSLCNKFSILSLLLNHLRNFSLFSPLFYFTSLLLFVFGSDVRFNPKQEKKFEEFSSFSSSGGLSSVYFSVNNHHLIYRNL